jgi:hypothetical protein
MQFLKLRQYSEMGGAVFFGRNNNFAPVYDVNCRLFANAQNGCYQIILLKQSIMYIIMR